MPASLMVSGLYGALPTATFSTSAAWPTAKKVIYCPVWIPETFQIGLLSWANGTPSGNIEVGVYNKDGVLRCTTGSLAQTGTNVRQSAAPTVTTVLYPGPHYLAVTLDNATGTLLRSTVPATMLNLLGCHYETTSSFGLPTQASWANMVDAYAPACGIAKVTAL